MMLFTFVYPLLMSYVWMAGAIAFYWRHERHDSSMTLPVLSHYPMVSLLLPCHNEQENVASVVGQIMRSRYRHLEVLAVNDGSSDATARLLDQLATEYPRLRVLHLTRNQGKAVALNTAVLAARGDILVGIDGDAWLEPNTICWLVRHFNDDPSVGAVTGNPRIRTRSTALGRIQVGEFSSIIGLIKRAQHVYGRLFTVSGVVVAFRRSALKAIGYWSHDMLTEDIDVSWKLQTAGWQLRYEPNARVWILMPETLRGLWKQRLRWAMGGVQVMRKYGWIMGCPQQRRMWPIYLEYMTSVLWAYLMAASILLTVAGSLFELPIAVGTIVPGWTGMLITCTCLLQFLLSLCLDSRYDFHLFRNFLWMIWYPIIYWTLNMTTTVWAVPKVLMRPPGQRALWVSPDRGFQSAPIPGMRYERLPKTT